MNSPVQADINIAVVGATGLVGETMLAILKERDFPVGDIAVLASSRSAGKKIEFKGKKYVVEELTKNSFEGIDIALFSASSLGRLSLTRTIHKFTFIDTSGV